MNRYGGVAYDDDDDYDYDVSEDTAGSCSSRSKTTPLPIALRQGDAKNAIFLQFSLLLADNWNFVFFFLLFQDRNIF